MSYYALISRYDPDADGMQACGVVQSVHAVRLNAEGAMVRAKTLARAVRGRCSWAVVTMLRTRHVGDYVFRGELVVHATETYDSERDQ